MNILAYSYGYSCILLHIPDDLKQVSNTVAGVDLSDHVVQVVFTLFDENSKCTENVTVLYIMYCIAGNFREVQIFAIFATHDQNVKIRTAKYEPRKVKI